MANIPSHSRTRRTHRRTYAAGEVIRRSHGDSGREGPISGAEEVYEQIAIDEAGQVTAAGISPGAVTGAAFASTVAPVLLVHGLPTLPNSAYPVDVFVYDIDASPKSLWKNVADVWQRAIGPDDIQANSITAGQIAAGAVSTSELAVGARLVGEVANDNTGTPGVFIDSTGILIRSGKLTLQDAFGETTMQASGFSGSWADFLAYGLYNGALRGTVTASLTLGRTSQLPYWTIARDNDGIPAYPLPPTYDNQGSANVEMQSDASYPGGFVTKHTWSGLGENTYLISDLIPVVSGYEYPISVMAAVARIAGQLNIVSRVITYDKNLTKIDDYPVFLAPFTVSMSPAQVSLGTIDEFAMVAKTRYIRLIIHCYETVAHSASNYIKIGAVSLGPGHSVAASLHVGSFQADGAVTANSSLTVTNTINALGDLIVASGGLTTLGGRLALATQIGATVANKFMQSGSINIAMGGAAFAGGTLTFPTAFDNAPLVMVSRRTSGSGAPKIHVALNGAPTTASVALLAATGDGTTSTSTVTIDWLAIDMTKIF